MRTFLWLAVVSSHVGFAGELQFASRNISDFTLQWKAAPSDFQFEELKAGRETFLKIPAADALNLGFETTPNIPRLHRWIVVSPNKKYQIKVELLEPKEFSSFLLAPVAKDVVDLPGQFPELTVGPSYAADKWWGQEGAVLGERVQLGNLTLLPVTITPFHYNPARRVLRGHGQVRVKITAEEEGSEAILADGEKITPFVLSQAMALTLNGDQLLRNKEIGGIHLIVTNEDLLSHAQELGKLHHPMLHDVRYEVVPKGLTSTQLRQRILDNYPKDALNSVLLFGDESRIPLHSWSSVPGDWYYALLRGDDNVADIGLGRLPVSDAAEASVMVRRTRAYYELSGKGHTSKKLMLVAHKENYPGKYTANQEVIRKSPNPRELEFTTHYGGNKATNADVLRDGVNRFALINYRGHGSNTTWSGWGSDGKSFGFAESAQLSSKDENLAVVFNIACNNGAIQSSSDSLTERMLFPPDSASEGGVVAALSSTIESYTATNDRFDIHLFQYLQEGASLALGNVVAYANNKLVQESGGSLPYNTKLYILFSDPLLTPWIPH